MTRSEVKQTLKWSCGDRYTTFKQSDAVKHVEETGHTMDVKGVLVPTRKLARKRKARPKKESEKASKSSEAS